MLLLCSTSGEVRAFTVPVTKSQSHASQPILPKDDPTFYRSSRITVISSSSKSIQPKTSIPFHRTSTSLPSRMKGGSDESEPEIIVKRRLPSQDEKLKDSKWDSFKGAIYKTFDVIGEVPSKVSIASSNDDTSSDLGNRKAPMAYSNTVGETTDPPPLLSNFIPEEPETPGEKLLKQYQSTGNISVESNNDNLDYTPLEEDDLYRSDFRKKFDSAKDGIYNSFDFISRSSKSIADKRKSPALLLSDSNRIRPMAKTSINKEKGRANEPLSPSQRNRQQREKERKRKRTIEGTKETLYNVIDGIQTVGEVVVTLPKKVGQTVEVTQDALVGASIKVQDTIEGAQAFPGKVKNLVEDVRDSVEETKRITEEVSLDIKNIPKTVEGKISDTKNSIRETKEGVLNAVKRGEEVIYSAKVIAGLAKPKPKPPPPPKPKKASDVALKLAGSFAWFVAKGTSNTLISGTKVAWSAFGPSSRKAANAKQSNDDAAVINKAVQDMNILKPKPSIQLENKVDVPSQGPSVQLSDNTGVISVDVKETAIQKTEPTVQSNDDTGVIGKAVKEKAKEKPELGIQLNDDAGAISKDTLKPEPIVESNVDAVNPTADPAVSQATTRTEFEKPTLAEVDPSLDREVSDALRLAEEALASLEKEEEENVGVIDREIDAALLKAKLAAAKATKDVAELQEFLLNRKRLK